MRRIAFAAIRLADAGGVAIEAECKGGAIETGHRGPRSRLDKSLCEIVGRLMSKPSPGRQVAVMPRTEVTLRLALAADLLRQNATEGRGASVPRPALLGNY